MVYLKVDLETLTGRLKDIRDRGVVLRPGQTLAELYRERVILYEKYADLVVPEAGGTLEDTVLQVYRNYMQAQQ